MRCYFMRANRIESVEFLKTAPDEDLIREAKALFDQRGGSFDGFEVWDGKRFVYRPPSPDPPPTGRS
jgi:hypothetical protein